MTTMFPSVPLKTMDLDQLNFELVSATIDLPAADRKMILSAATMATHLHSGQTRRCRDDKPRVPYIEHPLRVALRILRWGIPYGSVITAALLHDVLEDCAERIVEEFVPKTAPTPMNSRRSNREIARDWIQQSYGYHVADAVNAVTSVKHTGFSYTAKIQSILDHSLAATLIKASDLVDNAGSLQHQKGFVEDSMITKLANKYHQPVWMVHQKLFDLDYHEPAGHLYSVLMSLEPLTTR